MRIGMLAAVLLVVLRLCIGWHFFIEGIHKIHTHQIGATATNVPWTASGFFRAGSGPLAEGARILLRFQDGVADPQRMALLDEITMWALAGLGGLLLVGLFCRPACFLLALFLVCVTLIAPATPSAPGSAGGSGHYLFVNLYTIEMMALFALATLPTGRWFGVDVLWQGSRSPHESSSK